MALKCDVCAQQISRNELTAHIRLHQSQMLRLVEKLDHRQEPSISQDENGQSGSNDNTCTECPTPEGPIREKNSEWLCCPDCKKIMDPRRHVRHYGIHCEYNTPCECCLKTFGKASAFLNHNCLGSTEQTLDRQRTLGAQQRLAVRQSVRDQLDAKVRKRDEVNSRAGLRIRGNRDRRRILRSDQAETIMASSLAEPHIDKLDPPQTSIPAQLTVDGFAPPVPFDSLFDNSIQHNAQSSEPQMWVEMFGANL